MIKERLSKLQQWILINWDNPQLDKREIKSFNMPTPEEYKSSMWIYYNFFGITSGHPTFNGRHYRIPNKYVIMAYRNLVTMEKKGLIEILYRGTRDRGHWNHLYFKRTEKGKHTVLHGNNIVSNRKMA